MARQAESARCAAWFRNARTWAGGALLAAALACASGPGMACGVASDCVIGDRAYRIALPEGEEAPVGALIYAHGYRGSAAGVMRNSSLLDMAAREGLAIIALDARGDDWVIPHAPGHPDTDGAGELAYVAAVIADAADRFAIDTGRVMAAGFSSGAMLVWTLACEMPERFAGFVAVAGTFWQGPPAHCATPVASLLHIHGTSDSVVPLGGRAIRETRQGDVQEALSMYRALGGFTEARAPEAEGLSCRNWRNADGEILDFCLHPGGHAFRTEYLSLALDRLRAAGRM